MLRDIACRVGHPGDLARAIDAISATVAAAEGAEVGHAAVRRKRQESMIGFRGVTTSGQKRPPGDLARGIDAITASTSIDTAESAEIGHAGVRGRYHKNIKGTAGDLARGIDAITKAVVKIGRASCR